MSYLIVNATTEDFLNPINYIKRSIEFLEDSTFDYLNERVSLQVDGVFTECKLGIKNTKQSVMMETPNRMELSIIKDTGEDVLEYKLSTISYGISTENDRKVCYV